MVISKKLARGENPVMRFLSLVRKELALIWSDKLALAIVIALPVFATITVGATMGNVSDVTSIEALTSGREVDMGVVNLDTSLGDPHHELGEEFIKIVAKQPFTTVYRFDSIEDAEEALYYEQIMGYMIIRDGFEFNVSSHLPAFVEFYSSSLYILAGPLMAQKINDAIKQFKQEFNFLEDEIEYETQEIFKIDSPLFVALPMIVSLTLFASGLMLACQSVVGDSPWLRVALTPAKRMEIVSAKVVGYTILGTLQGGILLAVPTILFNLHFAGSFLDIWGFCAIISLAANCFGVFFSTLARTKLQGSQFFLLGFMISFILGSGMFLSGVLEDFFPLNHFQNGFVLLAYKDAGFAQLWPYIWPQLGFAAVFFGLAYIFLRTNKAAI